MLEGNIIERDGAKKKGGQGNAEQTDGIRPDRREGGGD